MSSINLTVAEIGALIGDPARANILAALMDGRALTAGELAFVARVAPQTASGHLAKLSEANLLVCERRGRNRYYRLASSLVGSMIETMMAVASVQLPPRRVLPSRIDAAMRTARSCYDHIAGQLGVGIAASLIADDHVRLGEEGGEITESGLRFLADFGARIPEAGASRRPFCRACLDWSERRWHLAGVLGAALLVRCLELGWIIRQPNSRALTIPSEGRRGFAETFGVELPVEPSYSRKPGVPVVVRR